MLQASCFAVLAFLKRRVLCVFMDGDVTTLAQFGICVVQAPCFMCACLRSAAAPNNWIEATALMRPLPVKMRWTLFVMMQRALKVRLPSDPSGLEVCHWIIHLTSFAKLLVTFLETSWVVR